MAQSMDIAKHPDIVALRERYDLASASVVAQVVEGLTLLAAFFLAASPWIVGFRTLSAITVTDLIAGGALTLVALGLSVTFGRLHGLAWLVPAIGVWTIIAPWSMAGAMDTARTIWSNAFAGGAIVVLGLSLMVIGYRRGRKSASLG